jgi:hypothetical protein
VTRLLPPVALAALLVVLAGAATGRAARPSVSAASPCAFGSKAGSAVGTITSVLHSTVYVGEAFVGATPFDVPSGSLVCTDAAGQAVVDFSRSKRGVVCVALESTTLQVAVPAKTAATLVRGSIWCSLRGTSSSISAALGGVQLRTTGALVGLVTDVVRKITTVKVVDGTVLVATRLRPSVKVSSSRGLLLISTSGAAKGPGSFQPTSAEQVAIARVRLAQPSG